MAREDLGWACVLLPTSLCRSPPRTALRRLGCPWVLICSLFDSVLLLLESCRHWCVARLLFWLISHWFVVSFVSFCFSNLFLLPSLCVLAVALPLRCLPQRTRWSNVSLWQTFLLMRAPAAGASTETVTSILLHVHRALVESCWQVFWTILNQLVHPAFVKEEATKSIYWFPPLCGLFFFTNHCYIPA